MSKIEITTDLPATKDEIHQILCSAFTEYRSHRNYGDAEAYVRERYPFYENDSNDYFLKVASVRRNFAIVQSMLCAVRDNTEEALTVTE